MFRTEECGKITTLEMYHDRDGLADTKKSIDNQVHVSYRVFRALKEEVSEVYVACHKNKKNIS